MTYDPDFAERQAYEAGLEPYPEPELSYEPELKRSEEEQ